MIKHFSIYRFAFLIVLLTVVDALLSLLYIDTTIHPSFIRRLFFLAVVIYIIKIIRYIYDHRSVVARHVDFFISGLQDSRNKVHSTVFTSLNKTYNMEKLQSFYRQLEKYTNHISIKMLDLSDNSRVLIFVVVLGILIRVGLVLFLPVSNDEGYYFYDAYFIRQGLMPYVDYLTKSGPHIYLIALITSIGGNTIFAGRLLTIIVFVLNVSLMYQIVKHMVNKKAAWVTVVIFSLYPEIAALTSYAQTQQTQTFFYLLFLYVAFVFRKSNNLLKNSAFALTFTLAYLARQTSAVLLLAYWMFELYELVVSPHRNIKRFFQVVIFQGMLLGLLNTVIFYFLYDIMGLHKALDVYGMGVVTVSADTSIRQMNFVLEFFSQNIAIIAQIARFPLFFFCLLYFFATTFPLKKVTYWIYYGILVLLTGWIFKFTGALDSKLFLVFTFSEGFLLYLFILWNRKSLKNMGETHLRNDNLLFFFFWFVVYFFMYSTWIKFRIPYLVELFPLLAMMGGAMMNYMINHRKLVGGYLLASLCIFLIFYQVRSYTNIYSGSFSPKTVYEVAELIRSKTEADDYIMTASPIFPFIAERKLPMNISHPSWYGIPDFDERLLVLYLPRFENLERYVLSNKPKIIIVDEVGNHDYFDRSKPLQHMIKTDYKLIKKINERTIQIEIYELKSNR